MDPNTFPTKGNLILAKNSLKLAHMGYELMDKKRNILIRELMGLIDEAKDIQRQIDVTFREAYAALQIANMEIGITNVQTVSYTVPVEESIRIKTRSIMGVEIPLVEADPSGQAPTYAYYSTKESLDQARQAFEKVKDLTLNLSMIDDLQSCELFALLLLQCVRDILGQLGVMRNRDVLQRIGALLCFLDCRSKAVCRVLNHGKV